MIDFFDKIPFDNQDGGVWKQGWDVSYEKNAFDKKTLLVFVMPHSHNDPGIFMFCCKTFVFFYTMIRVFCYVANFCFSVFHKMDF